MMARDIDMGQAFLSGTLAAQELSTRTDKWVAGNTEMFHSKRSHGQSEETSCGMGDILASHSWQATAELNTKLTTNPVKTDPKKGGKCKWTINWWKIAPGLWLGRNANQSYADILSHPSERPTPRKGTSAIAGVDVGREQPCLLLLGM